VQLSVREEGAVVLFQLHEDGVCAEECACQELMRMISPAVSLFCVRDEANFYETRSWKNLLENHGYLAGERVNDLS
jgi:hypothetical protein